MASSHIRPDHGLGHGKWLVPAVALGFVGLLSLRIADVFAGGLPAADDLMRLQQVRDLLDGQNWFNVDQSRMLTPEGGNMHWSRLPDMFLACVVWLTEPLLGRETAEKLAVSVWPLVLLGAAFTSLSLILRRLGAHIAGQAIGLVFFAFSAAIYNFWPGRIDHHGLVVVLALIGLAAALSPRLSARSALVLAIAITAMLSVALEGLPYVAGLIAIMGLFWIIRGHREGVRLAVFGLGLVVFSTLFYALDAPGFSPRRYVCDAYGTSHWVGLACGGALLSLLGIFGGVLDTWVKRLIAGGIAGAVTLALIIAINPACLGDPYAAVPDSVRLAWLSVVGEAKPLSVLLIDEPDRVVWVFGFLAVSVVATGVMIANASAEQRLARIGFAILFGLSILATIWQIRGQSFSHLFAAVAAGWLAGHLFGQWRKTGGSQALLIFAAGALVLSPMTWETLSQRFAKPLAYAEQGVSYNVACTRPGGYQALASRSPLRIHAPVILNGWVLAYTPHSVFGGPYHRNIDGIANLTDILIGAPEAAQDQLLALGATHLIYCNGLNETNRYGLRWPGSFAAALNRDEVPDWLVPDDDLTETKGVVRLYRIVRD